MALALMTLLVQPVRTREEVIRADLEDEPVGPMPDHTVGAVRTAGSQKSRRPTPPAELREVAGRQGAQYKQ